MLEIVFQLLYLYRYLMSELVLKYDYFLSDNEKVRDTTRHEKVSDTTRHEKVSDTTKDMRK